MNPDPHADDADREWAADRLAQRLAAIRAQRPARLTRPGEQHPEVAAWGERLLAGKASTLLLGGPTGSGKTWEAHEVLERAVAAGFPGRIMFLSSAVWRDTISPPVERELLRTMRLVEVLVFDDLGSGRINEWEKECLLGVVDERWANDRPIVVTFNVESLRETLGERIASRLADGATKVLLTGDDRRRRSQ